MTPRAVTLVLVLLAPFLLAGCTERDVSTPSNALVGHWYWEGQVGTSPLTIDFYFAPIDDGDDGTFISVTTFTSTNEEHATYRVLSEGPDGDRVTIEITSDEGNVREERLLFTQEFAGLVYKEDKQFRYMGPETAP